MNRRTTSSNTAVKTLASALLVGAAMGASSAAFADSPANQRGYQNCVKEFDTQALTGVTFPRTYYINQTADTKVYYLNASAWENGDRVTKRITCETSKSGRSLLAFEAADGRFALADRNRLNVAER